MTSLYYVYLTNNKAANYGTSLPDNSIVIGISGTEEGARQLAEEHTPQKKTKQRSA